MRSIPIFTLVTALAVTAAPALACDGPGNGAKRAEVQAQALAEADRDGNGALSAEEFEGFKAALARARADHMFAKLDADGDGQVTPAELDAAPTHTH